MTDVKCFKRQFTSSRWVWNDIYLQADDSLTHRFMVPRMLPPTPFVGNSDILVPSPIVSFILTLPKQPQSTEKENENMPLSRFFFCSFTPWPFPDQTSGSSDNCRVTDVITGYRPASGENVQVCGVGSEAVKGLCNEWKIYTRTELAHSPQLWSK